VGTRPPAKLAPAQPGLSAEAVELLSALEVRLSLELAAATGQE
jgi:hypothetical protein